MVNILCSPPGNGKSEYIYSDIKSKVNNGCEVLLIVPEQAVLITETKLAHLINGSCSLRLEVLSFKRLCNRVFRKYGGLCYNYINKGGQAVVFWRVLSDLSGAISEINISNEVDEALTNNLLALYKTFKACKISSEMLENACTNLSGRIAKKMEELSSIFSSYASLIDKDYDDACDDLTRLYDTLCLHDFFTDKYVYFDFFYDFNLQELAVISETIKQAKECTFTVEYDVNEDAINYLRPSSMKKSICEICDENKIDYIIKNDFSEYNMCGSDISYCVKMLWNRLAKPYNGKSNIDIVSCNGIYDEAETAANITADLVRKGYRYKEIAIISRDITEYEGIIDVALCSKGIPCHISQRNRLAIHPAVRAIFGALDIISYGWQSIDVISYMKTGLTSLLPSEVNSLAAYIRLWNIKGEQRYCDIVWNMNPDSHTADFADDSGIRLAEINSFRERLISPILKLKNKLSIAATSTETSESIYSFMVDIGLDKSLNNYEDYFIWNAICEVLEQYARCASPCQNVENVSRILNLIVSSTDIGKIPPLTDEIICGSANNVRLTDIKYVIILGANEGKFPRRVKDDSFFTEIELEKLAENGIRIPDRIEMRSNDEHFFFVKALSFASEGITVCYSDENRSEAVERLSTLFNINCPIFAMQIPEINRIHNISDVKMISALTANKNLKLALQRICEPEKAIKTDNNIITSSNISFLYPGDLSLTKTRIECFETCPYKYRCDYDISLSTISSAKFLANERGTFLHAVFENTLKRAFSDNSIVKNESDIVRIAEEESKKYISLTCGENFVSARILSIMNDFSQNAVKLIQSMYRELSNSDFRPLAFEIPIGENTPGAIEPYYIPVSYDKKAMIYGKIDRIDVLKKDNDNYLRIIDYKSGNEIFKDDNIAKHQGLQMPLYLLSLLKNTNDDFKKKFGISGNTIPSGFLYYCIGDKNLKVKNDKIELLKNSDYIDDFFTCSGVALNDTNIASDMKNSKYDDKYIIRKSLDDILDYDESVTKAVREISNGILSGDCSISKNPVKSYCRLCVYHSICRRREKFDD